MQIRDRIVVAVLYFSPVIFGNVAVVLESDYTWEFSESGSISFSINLSIYWPLIYQKFFKYFSFLTSLLLEM